MCLILTGENMHLLLTHLVIDDKMMNSVATRAWMECRGASTDLCRILREVNTCTLIRILSEVAMCLILCS